MDHKSDDKFRIWVVDGFQSMDDAIQRALDELQIPGNIIGFRAPEDALGALDDSEFFLPNVVLASSEATDVVAKIKNNPEKYGLVKIAYHSGNDLSQTAKEQCVWYIKKGDTENLHAFLQGAYSVDYKNARPQ